MKRLFTQITFSVAVISFLGLFSCSEKDPLPVSQAGFKVTTVAPEVDLPVQFENLSLNASVYAWDFGDGTTDSLTIDPVHTYETPGNYMVKLTAYTEDGQKSESVESIRIGERFLTAMFLININMLDENGDPWDSDGSGPDVLFQFYPEDITTEEEYLWVFLDSLNVSETNKTPTGIELNEGYKLLNKNYVLLCEEINTDNEEEEPRYMDGVLFNPIIPEDEYAIVTKREDGTGDIVIPFVDLVQFQYFLQFEIR